jgi:hypothetical protein
MPTFLVLKIHLLLFSDGEGTGGIVFSTASLLKMRAATAMLATSPAWQHKDLFSGWRHQEGDDVTTMNNFLWCLLRFVVVRSGHDKGLGRIIFRSVFLNLRWHIKRKTQERRSFLTLLAGMLALLHCAFVLSPIAECSPLRSSIHSIKQV